METAISAPAISQTLFLLMIRTPTLLDVIHSVSLVRSTIERKRKTKEKQGPTITKWYIHRLLEGEREILTMSRITERVSLLCSSSTDSSVFHPSVWLTVIEVLDPFSFILILVSIG